MRLISFFIILLCVFTSGCTRKIYIPVENERVRTDTLRVLSAHRDSILIRDSVALIMQGDTVRITHYRDRVQLIERRDTLFRVACDTIIKSVPFAVERKPTISERVRLSLFWPVVILLIVAVAWLRFRRKG